MIYAISLHPDFDDRKNIYYSECAEVDPKTVCQYIGLKDCNDKRIFEGGYY